MDYGFHTQDGLYFQRDEDGNVIGRFKKGLHAWNVALRQDGVLQVEPQTAKLVETKKGYRPLIVII